MMDFADAMDAYAGSTTKNGRPSVAKGDVGDARSEAFFKLVRPRSREEVAEDVRSVLERGDVESVVDGFVMWAQTRDVRGGKGERDLAQWWMAELSREYPRTVKALLPLMQEFGSWRDYTALIEDEKLDAEIREGALRLFAAQIVADVNPDNETPSLACKWAPREGGAHSATAKKLAALIFPEEKYPNPSYRKAIAKVNKRIGTVEIKMCDGKYSAIDPGKVPARCLLTFRNAFLNRDPKGNGERSTDEDRVKCAKRFREHAEECRKNPQKAKMHGRVLHPHEMVKECMGTRGKGGWKGGKGGATEEDPIIEAQWVDLRERLRNEILVAATEENGGGLGRMVPLVDVSGSMHGQPMQAAIALGLLISEVGHRTTRDRFLTFETNPRWHVFDPHASLHSKVQSAMGAEWGGSTDFSKALGLVLDACIKGNVSPDEVGGLQLVVLSDMQFNSALRDYSGRGDPSQRHNVWETQYEELVRRFKEAGLRTQWKQAYPVPRVIFWNLRGDTEDFPATADTPGVDMISGFSANLLKLFMGGDISEVMESSMAEGLEEQRKQDRKKDPLVTMRKALDDPRYDSVREVCATIGEGIMAGYRAPRPMACE